VSIQQLLDPTTTLSHTAQLSLHYFRRSLYPHLTARRTLHFEDPDDVIMVLFHGVVEARFSPVVQSVRITLFVQQKFHDDWWAGTAANNVRLADHPTSDAWQRTACERTILPRVACAMVWRPPLVRLDVDVSSVPSTEQLLHHCNMARRRRSVQRSVPVPSLRCH
jgi:hypothetical protein